MAKNEIVSTVKLQMNIDQVKTQVSNLQKLFGQLKLPDTITGQFGNNFTKLQQKIQKYETALNQVGKNPAALKSVVKIGEDISNEFDSIILKVKKLSNLDDASLEKLFPKSITNTIKQANEALKTYNRTIDDNKDKIDAQSTALNKYKKIEREQQAILSKKKSSENPAEFEQIKQDLKQVNAEYKKQVTILAQQKAEWDKLKQSHQSSKAAGDEYKKTLQEVNRLEQERSRLENKKSEFIQPKQVTDATTKLNEAQQKIKEIEAELNKLNGISSQAFNTLKTSLSNLGIDLSKYPNDIHGMAQAITDLRPEQLKIFREEFAKLSPEVEKTNQVMGGFANVNYEASAANEMLNAQMRETDMLKSRIQYFFGLNNAIALFKRVVREAYNEVKELDQIMTETAVVTDFDVGDMWDKLPEYTARAKELGLTIQDVYKADTLFYQQGLKTNEVIALSNKTLQMARIAGLDTAEATDRKLTSHAA